MRKSVYINNKFSNVMSTFLGKVAKIYMSHLVLHIKSYMAVLLMFLMGLLVGIIFVNNIPIDSVEELEKYILDSFDTIENLGNMKRVFYVAVKGNCIFALLMYFFGTTIIGIPVVLGMLVYKGFLMGYTISIISALFGAYNAAIFSLMGLLLHNIIMMPALFVIAVSGMKLYNSIVRQRRAKSVKVEMIKHTAVSLLMIGVVIFATIIEVFVSSNLLKIFVEHL